MTGIVANAPIQNNLLNCNNVNVSDVVDVDSNNSDTERAAHLDRRLVQRRPSLTE